jgi:hypothetical protein
MKQRQNFAVKKCDTSPLTEERYPYNWKTTEKEVQDSCYRGPGGYPPALIVPQDWGIVRDIGG